MDDFGTGYSNNHGYATLIEGVEMKEQFDLLRSSNCREFQDFYLSGPKYHEDLR